MPHEIDRLSITYHVDSAHAFLEHLQAIVHSSSSAAELARHMPVKAMQKFDEMLPPELLDLANGHDHLDLEEARRAANEAAREKG
jgi:nucleotidyltransferase/DNA polymerase involved in DNA repair